MSKSQSNQAPPQAMTYRFLQTAAQVEPVPRKYIHSQIMHLHDSILYHLLSIRTPGLNHPYEPNTKYQITVKEKLGIKTYTNLILPLHKRIEVHTDANPICNPIDLSKEITETQRTEVNPKNSFFFILKQP